MSQAQKTKKSKGLGMGLSALIQASEQTVKVKDFEKQPDAKTLELKLESLIPGKFQPRIQFNEEELNELAESIKKNGVIQPILVRKVSANDTYEIIAGERRWRAAKLAGLSKVPAIIMNIGDREALEIGLVENIQRQNLNALEIAEGYQKLISEFNYTQEQLSETIGKSRAEITNYVRILSLPEEVKNFISENKISYGHARALLSSQNPSDLAKKIVRQNLNVRQTEKLVSKVAEFPRAAYKNATRDPDIVELEKALENKLGLGVQITNNGVKGRVVINYSTLEQLDRILKKLEA